MRKQVLIYMEEGSPEVRVENGIQDPNFPGDPRRRIGMFPVHHLQHIFAKLTQQLIIQFPNATEHNPFGMSIQGQGYELHPPPKKEEADGTQEEGPAGGVGSMGGPGQEDKAVLPGLSGSSGQNPSEVRRPEQTGNDGPGGPGPGPGGPSSGPAPEES